MKGKCIESCNVFIWTGFHACIVTLTIIFVAHE